MTKHYTKQTNKESYKGGTYDDIPRFVSYYHQQRILKELIEMLLHTKKEVKILEIGSGTAFLKNYIHESYPQVVYKVMDVADDLHPDYLGDMTHIDDIVHEKFDIVCAFQVLEHVQYHDALTTIKKIGAITDHLVISLPYVRLYFSLRLKVSVLKPWQLLLSLPFSLRKHKFDGQHYWELGTRGYPLKKFKNSLKEDYKLINEFSDPLNPWHRFYVLRNISFKK